MFSICLLTKNENKYLKEWITHHLNIGVDHFYIYDNNHDLSVQNEVLKYFDSTYFTFIPWIVYCKHMQIEAYNDCLKRFGQHNDWIAFIDTDEFIDCDDIHKAIANYKQYDYIKIPWVMYNADGQLYYSDAPVMERFKKVVPSEYKGWNYKSIVQPSKIYTMNVHDATSISNNCIEVTDIKLKHYYTRSLEEWVEKINRGSCSPSGLRRYEEFFIYNQDLLEYKDQYLCSVQSYNDCRKSIDIKIMAHPSRRDNVLKILQQLDMDESIVVYDDREHGGDALYTAKKVWSIPMDIEKTHRLVLQDDILLCDNFLEIVNTIINTMPNKVISLFNMLPSELVKNKQCCYKKYYTLSGVAIIMPKIYIQNCWKWIDMHCGNNTNDDLMIARYCEEHCIDMFTTVPAIVQHIGDTKYKSLLSAKYIEPRIAPTYTQCPTDDFTIFIPEKSKLQNFQQIIRDKRAQRILSKKG